MEDDQRPRIVAGATTHVDLADRGVDVGARDLVAHRSPGRWRGNGCVRQISRGVVTDRSTRFALILPHQHGLDALG